MHIGTLNCKMNEREEIFNNHVNGAFYRSFNTYQEARQYDNKYFKKYNIKVRQKRNPRNLPNSYDDVPIKSDTSWKKLRKVKKQYE